MNARPVVSVLLIAALASSASLLVRSAIAAEDFPPNVRPFFSVGPSFPVAFDDLNGGFGVAFGFEAEQSRRTSVLMRVEWSRIHSDYQSPSTYYPPTRRLLTTVDWSLAMRAYLRTRRTIRPYVDGGVGVRLSTAQGLFAVPASTTSGANSDLEPNGITATLRIGISTAASRRAGLFLDSGLDVLVEHPNRYALVPVRIGVVFP